MTTTTTTRTTTRTSNTTLLRALPTSNNVNQQQQQQKKKNAEEATNNKNKRKRITHKRKGPTIHSAIAGLTNTLCIPIYAYYCFTCLTTIPYYPVPRAKQHPCSLMR
jgi:methionyl-tRNA formyltransferase